MRPCLELLYPFYLGLAVFTLLVHNVYLILSIRMWQWWWSVHWIHWWIVDRNHRWIITGSRIRRLRSVSDTVLWKQMCMIIKVIGFFKNFIAHQNYQLILRRILVSHDYELLVFLSSETRRFDAFCYHIRCTEDAKLCGTFLAALLYSNLVWALQEVFLALIPINILENHINLMTCLILFVCSLCNTFG